MDTTTTFPNDDLKMKTESKKTSKGSNNTAQLKNRAENARLKAVAAEDDLRATVAGARSKFIAAHINKNLGSSRKRRRTTRTPDTPDSDLTNMDRREAMAHARIKSEESFLVQSCVQMLTDNVVGHGFRLIMTTKNEDWNELVQERWNLEKDTLDIRKTRTWGELQRMWYKRRMIDGDVGINMIGAISGGQAIHSIQTIEADRIRRGNNIPNDSGIEFDRFGAPKIYFIGPRVKNKNDHKNKAAKGRGIPADRFIHYAHYPQDRAERERGASMLLPNFNLFDDLDEILEAMVLKVKKESFMGLMFTTEGTPDGSLWGPEMETDRNSEDGATRRHVKMIPNMNLNLLPGEAAEVIESKSPNGEYLPFIRMMLRFAGTVFGLPLEMMLLDFSDTNFSGGRAILELSKKRFKCEQQKMRMVSSRVFQWWLARHIKHTDGFAALVPPMSEVSMPWAHRWGTPGWAYLDPVKEVQAQQRQLDAGLTSHQIILDDQGDIDFPDIIDQLGKEYKMMQDAGVPIIAGTSAGNVLTLNEDSEDE